MDDIAGAFVFLGFYFFKGIKERLISIKYLQQTLKINKNRYQQLDRYSSRAHY
tara:strand:+ start:243 stop:401 length:159 start_codon:yes stop_codon:yes gene_type:complete